MSTNQIARQIIDGGDNPNPNQLGDGDVATMAGALGQLGVDVTPARPGDDDPDGQFGWDAVAAAPGGHAEFQRQLKRLGSKGVAAWLPGWLQSGQRQGGR
jgi:hypothetical protein